VVVFEAKVIDSPDPRREDPVALATVTFRSEPVEATVVAAVALTGVKATVVGAPFVVTTADVEIKPARVAVLLPAIVAALAVPEAATKIVYEPAASGANPRRRVTCPTRSPVAGVYVSATVQLAVEPVFAPVLYAAPERAPYPPEPGFVFTAQVKTALVAVVDERAATVPAAADEIAFEFVGAEVTRATTVTVSVPRVTPAGSVKVTGTYDIVPGTKPAGVAIEIAVGVASIAKAGATEVTTPNPNEATATSAMRLKVVFVDICFLSISRSREFPPVGFG